MSLFAIEFSTDNAAFHDDDSGELNGDELARILEDVAAKVRFDPTGTGGIMDVNGNKVGTWGFIA